jgi:hypothetical protein
MVSYLKKDISKYNKDDRPNIVLPFVWVVDPFQADVLFVFKETVKLGMGAMEA